MKKFAIVVAVLVAGVLVYAAFQPDTFLVSRSVSINAASVKIYPYMSKMVGGDFEAGLANLKALMEKG